MPPKRGGRRGGTNNDSSVEPQQPVAPPSEEDAKPNVDQLNAAASSEAELPSDPTALQHDPISVNTTPAQSARSTPSVQQVDIPGRPTPPSNTVSRGKRPVAAPRGAGRRTQAQREELRKADDERRRLEAQQRAKEESSKAKQRGKWHDGDRGRGRGNFRGRGKGRGGFVGDFQKHDQEAIASGPFSGGEINKDKRSSGQWRTSGGISRGSQKGFSAGGRQAGEESTGVEAGEGGTFTTGIAQPKRTGRATYSSGGGSRGRTAEDGTPVKPDPESKPALDADGDISMLGPIDGGMISSDEDSEEKDNANRYNIENFIDLTRDDDDEFNHMPPMRVMRVAHKERVLGINADGATTKDGAIAVGANDEATSGKRKGKQKAKEDTQPVELSSGSDRETDTGPTATVKPDPEAPSAAEEQLQEAQLAGGESNVDDLHADPPSSPESKRKAKDKIKSRTLSSSSRQPERPELQTQEEVEEWEREQSALNVLRHELGTPAPTEAAEGEDEPDDPRANKVFLFQFPPVLPDLDPVPIKPDPDAPQPADGTGDQFDADAKNKSKETPINLSSADSNVPALPSGFVGKLNIHASGRATLDWGGTSFCLGMGIDAAFLQDVMLAQVPKQGVEGEQEGAGGEEEAFAMSMGQVKGKFVVQPDWDEILG